jgi:hypothetical protein
MYILKLLLLLMIAAVFLAISVWCYKRHRQFMKDTVEIIGISQGSVRVDLPKEVTTMYGQQVLFDCPFTKKQRNIISDIVSSFPNNDEGKPVKVYVSKEPPHQAKLKYQSLFAISLATLVGGSIWLLLAINYMAKHL